MKTFREFISEERINEAEVTAKVIDGKTWYEFSNRNIDYSMLLKKDSIELWKTNNQRSSRSLDVYSRKTLKNDSGKVMAKFIQDIVAFIE